MLPNRISVSSAPATRLNLPVWVLVLGAVLVLFAALSGWVVLSMGTPPEAVPVQTDIPVTL